MNKVHVYLDYGASFVNPGHSDKRRFRFVFKRIDGLVQLGSIAATTRDGAKRLLRNLPFFVYADEIVFHMSVAGMAEAQSTRELARHG